MNILLTNDDGHDAPGLAAAYRAIETLGTVYVVAPHTERSACGHAITLRSTIRVEPIKHERHRHVFSVEGTPADCVRLGVMELIDGKVDLVISGINRGANIGPDVYYSGTVAGAREGAMLGIPSFALSHATRSDVDTDWGATADAVGPIIRSLVEEPLPPYSFWSINLPTKIPDNPTAHVHRVPLEHSAVPMAFRHHGSEGNGSMIFSYRSDYWERDSKGPNDFTVVRDGGIAVTAIPVFWPSLHAEHVADFQRD